MDPDQRFLLDRLVRTYFEHMPDPVIAQYTYLLEPDRSHLVLAATLGLRPQAIGTLRLALHEGLVGLVAELESVKL